ncbi:hypothetical protein ACFZBZ_45815 [Streptomyces sp. NPDC008196]|uniref:hypothetical protein n=1 Tax=Streptomyces sp. NPDC008196 TaxID=3364819 RepID=UPI0036DFEEF4
MNVTADLKLVGVALVDGQPLACTDCGNTFSLEVHKRGPFETSAAWVCCLSCGHGGEHQAVTNGLVDAVLTGWVARQKDADRDMFTAEWRGTVLTGELYPTLDIYQARGAAKAVHQGAKPLVKRWWRGKKRAAKKQVKAPFKLARRKAEQAVDAGRERAGDAVAAAKAGALTAAWQLQTGGAGPTVSTRPKRRRCRVKGCRGGMVTIRTRVHSTSGKAQTVKVPCGMCHRAGGGQ